jgi:cytochrome c556
MANVPRAMMRIGRIVKPTSLVFVLIALFCTVGVASAAARLKSIMHDWKADAATAERILAGGGSFDETEMTRILQSFITGSQEIEARASGASAQANDIKGRFANFESDAKSAREAIGAKDQFRRRFAQLRGDCRSCHNVYAN